MRRLVVIIIAVVSLGALLGACGGGGGGGGLFLPPTKSSEKAITAYSFASPAATGTIDEAAKTITVAVPKGTNVTALKATFTTTGASVKVGATDQVSGTTANDFTNPVAYTVTAEDGSTATYTVTVAVAITLPKTGQTTSYANGDDGNLLKGIDWPNPRFTDNTDGTITDNLTGLMWLKNASCIATSYAAFDADGAAGDGGVTWQHALDFVAGINAGTYPDCGGGHTGWRLPNRKELRSLVNYGQTDSAVWLNSQGFTNVLSNNYWSSTTYADSTADAWGVTTHYGGVGAYSKTLVSYVWPVRSGQ